MCDVIFLVRQQGKFEMSIWTKGADGPYIYKSILRAGASLMMQQAHKSVQRSWQQYMAVTGG